MYFYLSKLLSQDTLPDEINHFATMRCRVGDIVSATDLKGTIAQIKITKIHKGTESFNYEIISKKSTELPKRRVLIQSLIDKHYLDKLLEIAPLAGITEIIFFPSDRSVEQELNMNRLQKILIRACEQSQRSWLPSMKFTQSSELPQLIQSFHPVVLEELELAIPTHEVHGDAVLVGPEGGWSPSEIEMFKSQEIPFSSMGDRVYPSWLAGYSWFHLQ